jgi:plastocyanin
MTNLLKSRFPLIFPHSALVVAFLLPPAALADTWQLQVGAQNGDRAHQALAFLPNEIWIHANDSITWSFPSNEVHTVTFLAPGQVRPNRFTGCVGGMPPDGRTPDSSAFDNSTCVNSGILTNADGKTYTVSFPATGNFKLVCLAHPNMCTCWIRRRHCRTIRLFTISGLTSNVPTCSQRPVLQRTYTAKATTP